MLEVVGSPVPQAAGEEKTYDITTTVWGSSPSAVVLLAEDITDPDAIGDVTTDVGMDEVANISSDVITLPVLKSLTAGKIYRIVVEFVSGVDKNRCYFIVNAKR